MRLPLILALALLPALPAAAGSRKDAKAEKFAAFQERALNAYLGEVLSELKEVTEELEFLQEFRLDPHSPDVPVVSALRRVDRAAAMVSQASATLTELFRLVPPGDLSAWTPLDERFEAALKLVEKSTVAAAIAPLYRDGLTIKIHPCPGTAMALYSGTAKEVRVRAFYGTNAISHHYLAALLVHEGQHALQDRGRGGKTKPPLNNFEWELEARITEARFWQELGAPADADFYENEGELLTHFLSGREKFIAMVRDRYESTPWWRWSEPAIAAPAKPKAAETAGLTRLAESLGSGSMEAGEAAAALKAIRDLDSGIRHNHRTGAVERLKSARETLGQVIEVLASYPKIPTFGTMTAKAEQLGSYPLIMRLGHGTLAAIMDELDAAREALSREKLSRAEEDRLRAEQEWLSPEGPRDAPELSGEMLRLLAATKIGAPLAVKWKQEGLTLGLVPFPDPQLEAAQPNRLLLPGRAFMAKPEPVMGAAWAVHLLTHRAQGLKPGAAPTAAQELAAWTAVHEFWYGLDEKLREPFAQGPGHRLLVLNAVWESGGRDLLRLHLRSR